jgi:thiamine-phosphate pyrophosphorylase
VKSIEDIRLYCFTPGEFLKGRDPIEVVTEQIRGGADVIQLREKEMSHRERLELGLKVRKLTQEEDVLFIVNDNIDLAILLEADGIHLGQDDIPIRYARKLIKDGIIGISTHSFEQMNTAIKNGADYIAIGPIYKTNTKKIIQKSVGTELLSMAKEFCKIPYIAIGGIGLENIESLKAAGCYRVAIISDIMMAPNIEARCSMIKGLLQ